MNGPDALSKLASTIETQRAQAGPLKVGGKITHASSMELRIEGISRLVRIGDTVALQNSLNDSLGEVIAIDGTCATVAPYEIGLGIGLSHICWVRGPATIYPSATWKGRVIDALAQPIDNRGPIIPGSTSLATTTAPPSPLERQRVERALKTNVKVIDLFTPLCAGQRIGIFAGSGVGKSTLLGMLARSRGFDTTIVALVGERGREVREFIDDILGPAIQNSIVVVSTSDQSPMMRRQAPRTAMTIAEYFRDRGENVLLIVDSITRYAHALREVALAAGEPPVARGYTPSVFSELPQLLERSGPGTHGHGMITGVFSVLVDGDDHNEPVADAVRGILDGHIVLSREIATRGQFPAVDILNSISRLSEKAWSTEEKALALQAKRMIAEYENTRELRMLGAYKPGLNRNLDAAIEIVPRIYAYLIQSSTLTVETSPYQDLSAILANNNTK